MCKIKVNIRKLLIIVLLLIMSVCFCACGQVNSSIISNSDGSVEEIVSVKLDVEKVLEAGYSDVQELKYEISADAKKEALAMKDKLNAKVTQHLLLTNDQDTMQILNGYYDGITVYESRWQENQYTIRVVFKNIDIYKYYYNISEENTIEMKEEEYFFYNKIYWYGNTMYLKHRELFEKLKAKYEMLYPNLINHDDAQLTYTYCADLRRQHSDADFIQKKDGKYYHTWIVDHNDTNKQIMFYYNIANTHNWIIVSLLTCLIVTIIMSTIVIIIKISKKNIKK